MSSPVNGPGPGGSQWGPQPGPVQPGYQQQPGVPPYPAAPPPPVYPSAQPQLGGVASGLHQIASTLRREGPQVARQMGGNIRQAMSSIGGGPEKAIAHGGNVREVAAKANIHHQFEIHDLETHSVEGPAGLAAYNSGANVVQVIRQFGIQSPANVQKLVAKAAEGLIFTHGMSVADTRQHLGNALQMSGWTNEAIAELLSDTEELATEGPGRWAVAQGHPPAEVAARMGISGEDNQSQLRVHAAVAEMETSNNYFTPEYIQATASKHRISDVRLGIALAHSGIKRGVTVGRIMETLGLDETSRPDLEAYAVANGPASQAIRNGENLLTIAGRYDIRDLDGSGLTKAALNGPARQALRQGLNRPQVVMEVAQRYGIPPSAAHHCLMQLQVARGMARPDAFGMIPPEIRRDLTEICAMGPMRWYVQQHGVPLEVAARAHGINLEELGTIVRNGL